MVMVPLTFMNTSPPNQTNRRDFIKTAGTFAAASALAGVSLPNVHAASSETIQVALIGCGGRGTGAASNALSTKHGPMKLVAMADVFEDKLNGSFQNIKAQQAEKVDVPADRRFLGFDGYKKAMDCLKPGDIAILATPPAFRWIHFAYAIEKGLNVFMEKPVTVDGPTSQIMLKQAEEATAKNLKVGVGLMSRHTRGLQELADRIHGGEIGDIILMRGYRMHGPVGSAFSTKYPGNPTEMLWQVRNFHSFLWASGGCYSDFYIHIIDHLCWMKNALPVRAQAVGGRHYKQTHDGKPYVDQNFDSYGVEYIFADGARMLFDGRCMNGCHDIYNSFVHGSKGSALASKSGDMGQPSSIFKGQNLTRADMLWTAKIPAGEQDPYQNEWEDLMKAIRNNQPYNEVKRGVETSLVTSMGRMAAHTGQEITFEDMLNCKHQFAPGLEKLDANSQPPVKADTNGFYPVPMPGIVKDREYGTAV